MSMMDVVIPGERANRDFRAKFPDDVMQENLAGQLWFGAEVICQIIQHVELSFTYIIVSTLTVSESITSY